MSRITDIVLEEMEEAFNDRGLDYPVADAMYFLYTNEAMLTSALARAGYQVIVNDLKRICKHIREGSYRE